MFTTVNRECVGPTFTSYKRQDNIQISDDLSQKGLLKLLSQITEKLYFDIIKYNSKIIYTKQQYAML